MTDRKRTALGPDLYARGDKRPRKELCLASDQQQGSSPGLSTDLEHRGPAGPAGENTSSLGATPSRWAPPDPLDASRHAEQVRLRSLAPMTHQLVLHASPVPPTSLMDACHVLTTNQTEDCRGVAVSLQMVNCSCVLCGKSSKIGYMIHML